MNNQKQKTKSKKHTKKYEEIELKIQKTVQKLVKKHPGNIQIKQVTDEVGITRQGFYEHYKSVDEAILKGGDKLVREYCKFLNKKVADADTKSKKQQPESIHGIISIYVAVQGHIPSDLRRTDESSLNKNNDGMHLS